jgi:hypothetical protein
MVDICLKFFRTITLLTFPVMMIGLIINNNKLIWGCTFIVFAISSLMLIHSELELRKSRRHFEEVHNQIMSICDDMKKQKAEKPKIKIP